MATNKRVSITEARLQKLLEDASAKAAEKAVKDFGPEAMGKFFEIIGLDVSTPEARAKLRQDFIYTRQSREGSQVFEGHIKKVFWGAIVLAILGAAIAGFRLTGGPPSP